MAAATIDSIDGIEKLDRSNMQRMLVEFDRQLERALRIHLDDSLLAGYTEVNTILWVGMGGSAIGGDILRTCLADQLPLPFLVNRDYRIPAYVNERSLVIASSYSGDTEETLSAYQAAIAQGAKTVCVTSGGALAAKTQEEMRPLLSIPPGFPPRAALGYLTMPVLSAFEKIGLVPAQDTAKEELVRLIRDLSEQYAPENTSNSNTAKRIARQLLGKIPIIYSATAGFESVALRWRCQLSENSKMLAHSNVFPELTHNEIVGWTPDSVLAEKGMVILLRDANDHPRIQRRMDITREILISSGASSPIEEYTKGESLLAKIFSLIYLGDWASFYLALLKNVDPTPIENINVLKTKL